MTIKHKHRLLFITLGLVVFILVVVGALVANWLSEGSALEEQVITTYQSISHPAASKVLFEDKCTGIGGGSATLSCGIAYYCALRGTSGSFEDVTQYYQGEFENRSWQYVSDEVYKIDLKSQVEIFEVRQNNPIFMNFSIPANILSDAWNSDSTVYLITVYAQSSSCPNN